MQITFTLRVSPDIIFDYLTDMDKFAFVHPVITKINRTGDNQYLVYETLKMRFIPFSFTYPFKIESDRTHRRVTMHATVMKLTHITLEFSIRKEGDFSIVEETITIDTFLPIKRIIENVFREQHSLLFRNIEMKERVVKQSTT